MFRAEYENRYSAVYKTIKRLDSLLIKRRVSVDSDGPRLIFLCGANKAGGEISARRQAIIDFAAKNAPAASVIIAENVFKSLFSHGQKKNLLDVEERLSVIADHVIIILEGEGAFCELGAFSHEALRKKLLVVNNARYRKSNSFINLGPIQAVRKAAGKSSVMWFPMQDYGIETVDGIGMVFPELLGALKNGGRKTRKHIDKDALDPGDKLDKLRLFFIHDLIFLAGPLMYKSLVDLVVLLFGEKDYKNLREAIALLTAISFVEYENPRTEIKSLHDSTFLNYEDETEYFRINFSMISLRNSLRSKRN